MDKKILTLFCFLISMTSNSQDKIKNHKFFHPRSTGSLIVTLSDTQFYTAECNQYGRDFCHFEKNKKTINIVEKKCFNNGNTCVYKLEDLERYEYNNELKSSRFALAQIKKEGNEYHLTSTNLKYDKNVINKIQLTQILFSEKKINERIKNYFSTKAKPEPYTWIFYTKSFLESLLNYSVELDSKFNKELKELVMKEVEENRLKRSEINNFINKYLIKKGLNPALNRKQVNFF